MEIHYCQMYTPEGLVECGFLCGAFCRANPKKPFVIDWGFHERIKTVGCQSWQRYMDYGERRERYGQAALDGPESGAGGTEGRTESTQGGREAVPLRELQFQQQLENDRHGCGDDRLRGVGNEISPSMPLLQEGNNDGVRKDPNIEQPSGQNLGPCSFCKEPAIMVDMRVMYCIAHAKQMRLIK